MNDEMVGKSEVNYNEKNLKKKHYKSVMNEMLRKSEIKCDRKHE